MKYTFQSSSTENTLKIGRQIAARLQGGEIFLLGGDVGVGKTVFVKGLAEGLKIDETVQSPTYTISQAYHSLSGFNLMHYDFYRLNEPGIMREELEEALQNEKNIIAIEWNQTVRGVVPKERVVEVNFEYTGENSRNLDFKIAESLKYILKGAKT